MSLPKKAASEVPQLFALPTTSRCKIFRRSQHNKEVVMVYRISYRKERKKWTTHCAYVKKHSAELEAQALSEVNPGFEVRIDRQKVEYVNPQYFKDGKPLLKLGGE